MPSKSKGLKAPEESLPKISESVLEELIPGPMSPAQFEGMFGQLKKSLPERALGAELTHHLGYSR
jgi:putative transposase